MSTEHDKAAAILDHVAEQLAKPHAQEPPYELEVTQVSKNGRDYLKGAADALRATQQ